jgi:hypothetical protein
MFITNLIQVVSQQRASLSCFMPLTWIFRKQDIGSKYQTVFQQFPFRSLQINTAKPVDEGCLDFNITPPTLEHDDTITVPARFGLDFDSDPFHHYFLATTPSVKLYLPPSQSFSPHRADYETLYSLSDQQIEAAAGDGSAYGCYMMKARAKIQKYFETGIGMPVPVHGRFYRPWMERIALLYTDLGGHRALLRGAQRKENLKGYIKQATRNVRVVDAILRVLRRNALDLCALIGAVELPTWRAHGDLAGVILYSQQIESFSGAQQQELVHFERWGMPMRIVERCEQGSRYEFDGFSRPERGQREKERLHQQRLAVACAAELEVKEAYLLEKTTVLQHELPDRLAAADSVEEDLDDLILAALLPDETAERIPFDEFERRLEEMTASDEAPVRWSRRRNEAGRHGNIEGRLWCHSRYYPFFNRNAPSFFARRAVPPHYHDPTLPFPQKNGQLPSPLANPPAIPRNLWHCIELRYFEDVSAIGEIMRFHPSILAYRTLRTQMSASEGGFPDGPKPFVLQLWGKDKLELARASRSLQQRFDSKLLVQTESDSNAALPSSWTAFVNTQYVELVLASSRPKAIRDSLISQLPRLQAPCALHPEYKPLKVRYIHFLRHEILGGDVWSPLTNQNSTPTPLEVMDCYEFTNEYLLNLVLKPRPQSLSSADFVAFHRLQIILEMLSGLVAFKMQLVANSGPISRLCHCIAADVQRDDLRGAAGCRRIRASQSRASPRMEGISWMPGQKRFALFLSPGILELRSLTPGQVEEWRKKERDGLESELAKKKHQPSAAQPSASSS